VLDIPFGGFFNRDIDIFGVFRRYTEPSNINDVLLYINGNKYNFDI